MEIKDMTIEQIEERKSAILAELETANDSDTLDSIENELTAIEERKAEIVRVAAEAEETRRLAAEEGEVIIETIVEETRTMKDIKEFRNSPEYIEAFAESIKTGKDAELRALLTENVDNGTIAIPDIVVDTVKTAWNRNEVMSLVRKVSIAGNLKVQFEVSGSDAVIHVEGTDAPAEETLTLGIVTLVPSTVKKWVSISTEAKAMKGEAFIRYIYDELTMKIAKKASEELLSKIIALPASATATSVSAVKVQSAPSMATVAEAIGNLSDEATNPVIVMNKLTWAAFKAVQYANNYAVDPFEGLKVVFSDYLPAYATASANAVYMIVGDFAQGAIANFPDGEGVNILVDEYTLATEDLIRFIGKEYLAVGPVANKAFTLVTKPTSV